MAARSLPHSVRVLIVAFAMFAVGCSSATQSFAPTVQPGATSVLPSSPPLTSAPSFPVTLTDDEGTPVTIASAPQKIVSLTPSSTETLFAIGAGSRVVGKVQDVANFPPAAKAVPEVATFSGVDVEKIISLGADLVISGGAGLTQGDAVDQLRRAHIPVLVSYPTTIDAALADIRTVGTAVGLPDAANTVADSMSANLEALTALASTAGSQPRLFYEIDITGGIFTPPADSIYGEMFGRAGARPIAGDANYSISLENLVAADPEVILLGDGAYGVTPESVGKRAGWGGMTAVKDHRIYVVDDVVITRPGPRLVDGLYALITAIHPELNACSVLRPPLPCPTLFQPTASPS
jgi:iron complex transport system substrate-binding protein